MNTQKGNKLIAEFIDFRWIEKDANWYVPTDEYSKFGASFKVDELKFYESWDWLMPVVEKIREIQGGVNIFLGEVQDGKYAEILEHSGGEWHSSCRKRPEESYVYEDTDIKALWYAVLEFIQWYNKQTCEHAVDVEDNYICPKCKDKE